MKENSKTIGRQGEDLATQALIQDGYQIVCRNYRQKYGEIDIIAKKNGTLYFVEVKAKRNTAFCRPAESVGPVKRRKVMQTALAYLSEHGGEQNCSFLIAEVYLQEKKTHFIEDSFAED